MKEGSFFIAYDLAEGRDISVLSVFVKEAGEIKLARAFTGKEAEKIYWILKHGLQRNTSGESGNKEEQPKNIEE